MSMADQLGIELDVIDVSDGYLEVLHHPQYGYGKNVNPCVDCRIYLFDMAKWYMEEHGAHFIFTGEVLGQRPKSQHLEQLNLIAKRSGLEDRLLRPLSARLLPPTLPEREGWVDRERLFGFHGRTRKPQISLAAEFGITGYSQPAGGCCFLTDPSYGKRVKDVWDHSEKDELEWKDYILLKTGRHLRVNPDLKVIVGRDEGENMFLDDYCVGMIRLEVEDYRGPVVYVEGALTEGNLETAARITLRYSQARNVDDDVTVSIRNGDDNNRKIKVKPFKPEEVDQWLIS